MAYDDDDLDDDDLDDDFDPLERAREIVAGLERRAPGNVRPVYVQPEPAITTEGELMEATHGLLEITEQELQSDDPATVQRAAERLDRFDALRRLHARNRPGRLA